MAQLFGFGKQNVPSPAQVMPVPSSFAEDDAGFAYFSSDQHHHHLAAAICKYLTDGRSFVLVTGEPQPSGELIADAINLGNSVTYRASVVQCLPDMDLGMLVGAYSAELGLRRNAAGRVTTRIVVRNGSAGPTTDPESGGIWTLMSYLTAERQNGVTRMLILKDADLLDARCFDDLQRLAQLDEQHIMPVILLSNAADRGALAPFEVLHSPIVGRLAVDHLSPEEVGAFIQSQLEALGKAAEMDALFPLRIVETIAVASGGNAAVVNRLARKVLVAFSSRARTAVPAETLPHNVGGMDASEGRESGIRRSYVSCEQRSVALADAAEVSAVADVATAVADETSGDAIVQDIEPTVDTGLLAEPLPVEAGSSVKSSTGLGTVVDAKRIPTEGERFEIQELGPCVRSTGEISRAGNEEQGVAGEIRSVRFTQWAEETEPTPVGEFQTTKSAVVSPGAFGEQLSSEFGAMPEPADEETAAAEASPVDTVVSDQRVLSAEQSASSHVSSDRGIAPRARSRSGIGWKLAVGAITVSVATVVALYSSGLSRRQDLPRSPNESTPQSALRPEARVDLPPLKLPEAKKMIAGAPPGVPPTVTSSPVVSISKPSRATEHSTSAAGERVRQSRDVTASGPPAASPAAPLTSLPRAPAVSLSQRPNPRVADQFAPEAQSPPASQLADTNAIMVQRGEQLLAAGDIVSARQFLERVAPGGNAAAAYELAETYDPIFLQEIGARGISGQPGAAIAWYQRAMAAGSAKAAARLHRLQSAISGKSIPDQGVRK